VIFPEDKVVAAKAQPPIVPDSAVKAPAGVTLNGALPKVA
jgi:hypothetical protein